MTIILYVDERTGFATVRIIDKETTEFIKQNISVLIHGSTIFISTVTGTTTC